MRRSPSAQIHWNHHMLNRLTPHRPTPNPRGDVQYHQILTPKVAANTAKTSKEVTTNIVRSSKEVISNTVRTTKGVIKTPNHGEMPMKISDKGRSTRHYHFNLSHGWKQKRATTQRIKQTPRNTNTSIEKHTNKNDPPSHRHKQKPKNTNTTIGERYPNTNKPLKYARAILTPANLQSKSANQNPM